MLALKKHLNQKTLSRLLLCSIILCFSIFVLKSAVNFPNADDFDSILDFVNRFFQTPSALDRFYLLFERHTQHFRTIDRLIGIAQYLFMGEVNFYFYTILGLVGLVLLFYLFTTLIESGSKVLSLSIALLMFQPCYVEVTQWANNCIQVIWVNIFVLLAFKLARSNFALTLFNSCIALLIQANGIVTLPIILLIRARLRSLDRKFLFYLVSFFIILVVFNFQSLLSNSSNQKGLNLLPKALYTLEMLGSSIGYLDRTASLADGILFFTVFLYFLISIKKTEEPLVSFLSFLIFSCLATAQFRYTLDHKSAYTTSRYTFVSILALINILCLIHNRFSSSKIYRKFTYIIFSGALLFNFWSYCLYSDQYTLRQEQISDSMLRWQLFKKGLMYSPDLRAIQILESSEKMHTFVPKEINPELYVSKESTLDQTTESPKVHVMWSIDHALCNEQYILIDGWAVLKKYTSENQQVIVSINEENSYLSQVRTRPDVNILNNKRAYPKLYSKSGFFVLLDRQEFKSDLKSISLFYLNDKGDWSRKNIDPKVICKKE